MTLPSFRAAIGFGANLGPARQALEAAIHDMGRLPWTMVEAVSSFYRSRPVDAEGPDYLNGIVLLQTTLGPLELLHALQQLELAHGRERPYRHAPRTLDLDVLWYEDLVRQTPELTLPHPRWQQRAFVLEPLAEVLEPWPDWGWPLPDAGIRASLAQQQGIERIMD